MLDTLDAWERARTALIAELQKRTEQRTRISKVEHLIEALELIDGKETYDAFGVYLVRNTHRIYVDFWMSQEDRALRMRQALLSLSSPFFESVEWHSATGKGCITIIYAKRPA